MLGNDGLKAVSTCESIGSCPGVIPASLHSVSISETKSFR